MSQILVGVVMGSNSDWNIMSKAVEQLEAFGIPHEYKVVSAHRTPDLLFEYASSAKDRGLTAIIAGAGGAVEQRVGVHARRPSHAPARHPTRGGECYSR